MKKLKIKFCLDILKLILSMVLIFVFSIPGYADVTRGCEGQIMIKEVGNPLDRDGIVLDYFEGRGACSNDRKANDCRRRAKDNILRCGSEIWDNRWNLIGDPNDNIPDHALPAICRGENTGVRNLGFKLNRFGKATDIKHAIEHAGCCKLKPRARFLQVSLSIASNGDRGCGNNELVPESRILWDNYELNCRRLRNQENICDN